jgi:hypothetical protein
MIDGDDCEAISGTNEWQEKLKYLEKTCPSTILFTIDTIRFDGVSNLGR